MKKVKGKTGKAKGERKATTKKKVSTQGDDTPPNPPKCPPGQVC